MVSVNPKVNGRTPSKYVDFGPCQSQKSRGFPLKIRNFCRRNVCPFSAQESCFWASRAYLSCFFVKCKVEGVAFFSVSFQAKKKCTHFGERETWNLYRKKSSALTWGFITIIILPFITFSKLFAPKFFSLRFNGRKRTATWKHFILRPTAQICANLKCAKIPNFSHFDFCHHDIRFSVLAIFQKLVLRAVCWDHPFGLWNF